MEQTKDVVTQIRTHYDSFSKSHRRLADFILENLHEVAFLSINELSQRTGISPATITRFARRLDFQGYPDLQRGLYEHQKQWAPFGQQLDRFHKIQMFHFHHKRDGASTRVAAEAIIHLPLRIHGKGRRFFPVERTKPPIAAAFGIQLHIS